MGKQTIDCVKGIWSSGLCRPDLMRDHRMKPILSFRILLKRYGYSEKAVREIWKWYDFSERKGIASF